MPKTILVICAHDDDETVGAMGSILKYIDEGNNLIKIVFSTGEMSHPHLKKEVIPKMIRFITKIYKISL